MATTNTSTSGALVAATAAKLASAYSHCVLLIIANNGVNPMVVKFGSAPQSATDGIPLDGATVAGGQGGSLVLTGDQASSDVIYGYSTLGTTFAVIQGGFQQ